MGLEHDISLEECFRLASYNNKNQITKIANNNTLITKISFKNPLEYKNEKYAQLTVESFYIKNMNGKTLVHDENSKNELEEFTQYFTNNKTILQDHLESIKKINSFHDEWYIEKQRRESEEYKKPNREF